MKQKSMGVAALVLTAALSLSACGGSANASAVTLRGVTGSTVQAEKLDVSVSANAFEDAFSSRDLSGTWDAASAVLISLDGDAVSCDSGAVTVSGTVATITAAGTYRVTGTLKNGSLIVDVGKEDKVQIVLDNVTIQSDTFAALYVKQADKVFLTLADGTVNTLSNGGTFEAVDENKVDGAIFSKDDLTLNGSGKLIVNSPAKHGIVSKDDLTITGGTYEVTAASHALSAKDSIAIADGVVTLKAGKDGIHAENDEDSAKGNIYLAGGTLTISASDDGVTASGVLQIDGGALTVTATEGLEANYIRVNDGTISVQASDDGINAARKSGATTPTVEINGGDISVTVGQGDTDCIDANGNLIITGGTVSVTGNSGFDVDGTVTFTGGTVIVNGQQVDTIPNQMGMGGRGGKGGFGGANGNNRNLPGSQNGSVPGSANGRNRPFADAQTGATPDGNTGKSSRPNGRQEGANRPNERQKGVSKGGKRSGEKTAEPENAIGKDAAKAKAFADAGITAEQAGKVNTHVSRLEDGTVIYKVCFTCGGMCYTYQINAVNGAVVDKSSEAVTEKAATETRGRGKQGGKSAGTVTETTPAFV